MRRLLAVVLALLALLAWSPAAGAADVGRDLAGPDLAPRQDGPLGFFNTTTPTTWNYIGLAIFAFCTVIYHTFYHFYERRHPFSTVKGKVGRYRKDWVESVLKTRNILLAVQTIRNTIMATTWMAGSLLLVEAFLLTSGIRGEESTVLRGLGITDRGFLLIKIDLLLMIYGFGFLMFIFAVRHLVLFNMLIGTSPELITQVEGVEASAYLAQLINRAHSRFTFGLRATYFSLPAIAWLFSTTAFIVLTLFIWLWLVLALDTRVLGRQPGRLPPPS